MHMLLLYSNEYNEMIIGNRFILMFKDILFVEIPLQKYIHIQHEYAQIVLRKYRMMTGKPNYVIKINFSNNTSRFTELTRSTPVLTSIFNLFL